MQGHYVNVRIDGKGTNFFDKFLHPFAFKNKYVYKFHMYYSKLANFLTVFYLDLLDTTTTYKKLSYHP